MLDLLSQSISGSPGIALLAAFGWGVISILLSPCHLSSIPLIIAVVLQRNTASSRRPAWILAGTFSIGILVTILGVGFLTALAGRMLGDVPAPFNWAVTVLMIAAGLYLMDVVPLDWTGLDISKMKTDSIPAIFVLGLIFGTALGPCTFAFLIPVLTVVFYTINTEAMYAISLLLAFAVGHSILIILAGTLMEKIQSYLKWSGTSPILLFIRRGAGLLVVLGGLYNLFK